MNTTILLVEDEKLLSESIAQYLGNSGITCIQAYTYNSAINKIAEAEFDAIVIDIGLPDGSGIDLINYIKKKKIEAGLIIISARNSLEDKLEGFTTGADDFIVKPFHLSELNARINAIIRRKKFSGKEVLEFNEIAIKLESRAVYVGENKINLTKKEFELLVYFISNTSKIITKDAIAYNLWKNNADLAVSSDIIYTHIKNLRKKLVEGGSKDYVNAIYGIGYKFGE
ncbi:MAG TPA: response regulator transcription factor [Bacteroidia bacterium]|jgi:DNA-binding response OmpR family regulator|nr:response regulator transcription factor [Bacteroidia bacterium]